MKTETKLPLTPEEVNLNQLGLYRRFLHGGGITAPKLHAAATSLGFDVELFRTDQGYSTRFPHQSKLPDKISLAFEAKEYTTKGFHDLDDFAEDIFKSLDPRTQSLLEAAHHIDCLKKLDYEVTISRP